jgi:hypothetical protein
MPNLLESSISKNEKRLKEEEMKRCDNCGKPIEGDAFRCIACFSWLWRGYIRRDNDNPGSNKRGHIYFIADEHERIKIGFAIDPEKRLKTFQNSNADELTILLIVPGTYHKEKTLHERFSYLRIGDTEWFEKAPEIVEFMEAAAGITPRR